MWYVFLLLLLFIMCNVCCIRALSGWLFLVLAVYCAWRLNTYTVNSKDRFHSCCVVIIQLIMLPTAIWDLVSTANSIKNKQGLPWVNQIVSWSMLGKFAHCKWMWSGHEFFKWPNPSSRTMAPRWTQPLTEMSTRNLPGGKRWLTGA
jgi:hypothetical protein